MVGARGIRIPDDAKRVKTNGYAWPVGWAYRNRFSQDSGYYRKTMQLNMIR